MEKTIRESLVELVEREKAERRIAPELPAEIIVLVMGALGDGLFLKRAIDPDFDPKPIIPAMMTMISALLAPVPASEHETKWKKS